MPSENFQNSNRNAGPVHIVTQEFNERARRCYGRIFPHQQRHRRVGWQDGRLWDEMYFDITEEEFDDLERV